jgi:hypothetical protein
MKDRSRSLSPGGVTISARRVIFLHECDDWRRGASNIASALDKDASTPNHPDFQT